MKKPAAAMKRPASDAPSGGSFKAKQARILNEIEEKIRATYKDGDTRHTFTCKAYGMAECKGRQDAHVQCFYTQPEP